MFDLRECSVCCNITVGNLCSVCSDAHRDSHTIVVVESPHDLLTIEQVGDYNGLYHVLHGAISPANGVGPNELRIWELVMRVEIDSRVREVILAMRSGQEGDATALYIQKNALAGKRVKMTRFHFSDLG